MQRNERTLFPLTYIRPTFVLTFNVPNVTSRPTQAQLSTIIIVIRPVDQIKQDSQPDLFLFFVFSSESRRKKPLSSTHFTTSEILVTE
jgi:hypothetical protein